METIDRRSRFDRDAKVLSVEAFLDQQLPDLLERHGALAGRGLRQLGLPPLGLDVDGGKHTLTLQLEEADDQLVVRSGLAADAMVVDFDAGQFSDFVTDQRSLNAFSVGRDAPMHHANHDRVLGWDRVWRALLDGWPVHQAGDVSFRSADGAPLDLHQAFGPEDDPAAVAQFLREAGFLRLRGWLDPAEMAVIADDMDQARPHYRPDDGRSWWATLSDGTETCVRMLHFVEHSATTAAILGSPGWDRLRQILAGDDQLEQKPVAGNCIEALIKPIGVVQGISDIPWHRDCSLGRHSYMCCGVTVGVSVTDGGADRGQLRVAAGSHRANVPAVGVAPSLDLPVVALPTEAGDLTVHLSCTLHEAMAPVTEPRKVMYTGFHLPERPVTDVAAASGKDRLWSLRNRAHKLQNQAPSPVAAPGATP